MSQSKYGKQIVGTMIAAFLLSGCGSDFKATAPEKGFAKDLIEAQKTTGDEEQRRKQAALVAYVNKNTDDSTDGLQRSSDDIRFIVGIDAGLIGTVDMPNPGNQTYKVRVSFYLNHTGKNDGELELINGEVDVEAEAKKDKAGKFIDIPLAAQSKDFQNKLQSLIKEQGLKLQASCKSSCRELILSIHYSVPQENSIKKINPLYQFIADRRNALGLLKIDVSSVADKFKYASQYYYESQAREANDTLSVEPIFGYTTYFKQIVNHNMGLKANEFFHNIDLDLTSHGMSQKFENLGQVDVKLTIKSKDDESKLETLEGKINLSWEDIFYTRKKSVEWSQESNQTKYKDLVFQLACYDRCNQVYVYSNTYKFNQVEHVVLARYQRNADPRLSIMELIESTLKGLVLDDDDTDTRTGIGAGIGAGTDTNTSTDTRTGIGAGIGADIGADTSTSTGTDTGTDNTPKKEEADGEEEESDVEELET